MIRKSPVTAALLLFAAAAALASPAAWEARLQALRSQGAAERRKLGLDGDRQKLYARFPTPEVQLSGDEKQVACGSTGEVAVHGRFPAGTAFVVRADDVRVAQERLQGSGWKAQLTVLPSALPRPVELIALAPVSGAERQIPLFRIAGKLDLSARFPDGWTARLTQGDGAASVAWSRGKEQRTTRAEVSVSNQGMTVRIEPAPEVLALQQERMQGLQSAVDTSGMEALMKQMEACQKLAQDAMLECMDRAGKQGDALRAKSDAKMAADEKAYVARVPKDAWACDQWTLAGAGAGTGELTGAATCAGERKLPITAQVRCLAP